jgi:protein TonB
MSAAIHAVVIAGAWGFLRTMPPAALPEPPASVMEVSLVDPAVGDPPAVDPPAERWPASRVARPQPSPDPAPLVEVDPPLPGPTVIPGPDPSPESPPDVSEGSPPGFQSLAEPPEDSVADTGPVDARGALAAAHAQYRPLVLAILERAKRYPLAARRRGLEGTVRIAFLIGADGTISDPRVIVPSPHQVLDEAALAMVHRIGSVPPPPDRIALRFPVSIEYTLESIASPISTEGGRP